ncbi:MAG: glutamine--fructose-6-phosphate transaminase (isomerizing) [Fibrobacterota bacterium]
MCGIVGYTGKRNIKDVLIGGLRRLEYRGYDSSGICIQGKGETNVYRALGKLAELEKETSGIKGDGACGIGHTRWATHGAPSVKNAHPHTSYDGKISIVHNGIIENYMELREIPAAENIEFESETDTEVLAHLIAHFYEGDLKKAVLKVLGLVHGTYGIAVVSEDCPGKIIAARRGNPIVLGIGEEEYFIGSDISSFGEYTDRIVYLADNDVAEITEDGYNVTNLSNASVKRCEEKVDFDARDISKGLFDHFMLKEIFEQPSTVRNSMRGRILDEHGTARLDGLNLVHQELRRIKKIIIIGCGTSYYAGLVGEYLIEELAGISVEVEYASEFRYRNPIVDDKTLVFVISQSGETADTLAALREARHKGATVLGISNVVGSTIARETDGGIYLHAGPEIGVASTKAFTSQVTVLSMLALMLGRMRRLSQERGIEICRELKALPSKIEEIFENNDRIKRYAGEYARSSNFLYLGRGYNFPVALEGALKLKEISYVHAEGYPAAEMKHGPIALIDKDMPVVFIATSGFLFDKVLSNMQEVKAREGDIIVITDEDEEKFRGMADHIIRVPRTMPELMPLLTVIPLQLLAYHIAVIRGCDVDQPRNLAKSVTVE